MKLFEHPDTDKTLDRLPELPPGVKVPDDISELHPPTTLKRTSGGVRWMRWLAAVVLLAGAGVLTAVLVNNGSDTEQAPVDYMQIYGTDNPTFVEGSRGPGTLQVVAPERSYMELYGTDNPTFVPQTDDAVDTGEYMRLYGTDNPSFPPALTPMEEFGTDNPDHLP